MRQNEKVSAEKVAQCEARAHRIVQTFLEPIADEAEFLNQLRWINPDHYQCITEERAIEKTCGYPLCEEKLVNIPTKKYQICTKKNKVYDLTYRKNFCSNECYKASNYLKEQLLTTPLWVREHEEIPKFLRLKNSTELMGEEINFACDVTAKKSSPNYPKTNLSEIPDKYDDSLKNYESNTESHDFSVKDKNTAGTSNFVLRVEKSLREWFTLDTLAFILGVESVKRMMQEEQKIFESRQQLEYDSYFYERYATICEKLKVLKVTEEKYANDAKSFEKPTQPLPDFATLEEHAREMEIKVRAFYRGDKKVTFDENKNENDESGTSVVLPMLHQHKKMVIRRNVVLDKFKKILPDLAIMLDLRTSDLHEEIKQFASTCQFSAHNVTFKPVEWNLVGLIFIKLLSFRDTNLQKHLCEKANYVNAMLMSYQLESNYLDLLCTWLMDLDRILKNDEEPS